MEKLAAVIAATVAIALAANRILAATRPAVEAFVPHRWGWLLPALLTVCGTLSLTIPMAATWVDYAVILVGAASVFAVAAQHGLTKKE